MFGQAFVVGVEEQEFTNEKNGRVYPWAQLRLMPLDADGTPGDVVTCSGVAGLAFDGMGVYDIEARLRMKDNRAGFLITSMNKVSGIGTSTGKAK